MKCFYNIVISCLQGAVGVFRPIQLAARLVLIPGMLTACGEMTLNPKEKLTIAMYGVSEAPSDATGAADPRYALFSLNAVNLTESETATDVYSKDATDFRIINRPQIIYEGSLTDYREKSISLLEISFASSITVGSPDGVQSSVSLTSPTIQYDTAFVVEKAKSVRLNIYVQWRNTIIQEDGVTTGAMAPSFRLVLGDD